jgi:hypothetical protein
MTTFDNSAVITTVKTAHDAVKFAGVTPGTSATVAPVGNATTWSHTSVEAAYASGAITASQRVAIKNFLAVYEQTQVDAARDTANLRGTYLAAS